MSKPRSLLTGLARTFAPLAVACPKCKAPAGVTCAFVVPGGRATCRPHPERRLALVAALNAIPAPPEPDES